MLSVRVRKKGQKACRDIGRSVVSYLFNSRENRHILQLFLWDFAFLIDFDVLMVRSF